MSAKYSSSMSRNYKLEMERDVMRERLVAKYKAATEQLLIDQRKLVESLKNYTPLMGLLKNKKDKQKNLSDDSDGDEKRKLATTGLNPLATSTSAAAGLALDPANPFKSMSDMAKNYNSEAASEWMKSLSMFPYAPPVFPGLSTMYRPPTFPYRGYAPRIRGRGRGRGRGARGGYDGQQSSSSSSHYNSYKYGSHDNRDYRYDHHGEEVSSYHKSSYSRGRQVVGFLFSKKKLIKNVIT